MRCEMCVDGDATQFVEGLALGGTVWKGTDGCAASYRCGKSIFGQRFLSAELGVTIDAQVEAPGLGKWWLDGKTGSNKRHCQRAMCMIYSPEAANSGREIQAVKWVERGGKLITVSPAEECVCLLSNPTRINGIKSEGMRASMKVRL
jgi:hypothetical protein